LKRRGLVLPLAMLLGLIILGLGFALSSLARQQLVLAAFQIRSAKAQAAADAGLAVGVLALSASSTYTGTTTPTPVAEGPETYLITVYKTGAAVPDGQIVPTGCAYVRSVGQTSGVTSRVNGAMVKLGGTSAGGLQGVFVNSLMASGGCLIDSYNSSTGPYAYGGTAATVMTNSNSAGSLQLLGSSVIRGAVTMGVGATVDKSPAPYTVGSSDTIWQDWGSSYTSSSAMTSAMTLPPVVLPAAVGTTDLTINYLNQPFPPGNYRNVYITGGARAVFQAGTYVVGNLTMDGGASLTNPTGTPALVYVSNSVNLNNGVSVSTSSVAAKMVQMYLMSGASYNQVGGASMTGVVYGPGASAIVSGGSNLYGSLTASSLSLIGSGDIHYDTALTTVAPFGGSASSGGATVLFQQRAN
jgi:hypothetical protein